MTKIQELADRAKHLVCMQVNPTLACSIIDELAGLAGALDATWHDHEAVPEEVIHEGERQGHSDDVLIDIDGWRKNFAIGWYDFDANEWRFDRAKYGPSDFEPEHMKWQMLPLKKYDV